MAFSVVNSHYFSVIYSFGTAFCWLIKICSDLIRRSIILTKQKTYKGIKYSTRHIFSKMFINFYFTPYICFFIVVCYLCNLILPRPFGRNSCFSLSLWICDLQLSCKINCLLCEVTALKCFPFSRIFLWRYCN